MCWLGLNDVRNALTIFLTDEKGDERKGVAISPLVVIGSLIAWSRSIVKVVTEHRKGN